MYSSPPFYPLLREESHLKKLDLILVQQNESLIQTFFRETTWNFKRRRLTVESFDVFVRVSPIFRQRIGLWNWSIVLVLINNPTAFSFPINLNIYRETVLQEGYLSIPQHDYCINRR